MIYALAAIPILLLVAMPWFSRWGQHRLDRDTLELQALYGQIVSELRADAYFRH